MECYVSSCLRKALPSSSVNAEHVVYWLYDSTCQRPNEDGYVGVTHTSRLHSRILEHRRSNRFPENFEVKVLATGYPETCYLYEFVLRPKAHIAWNRACGGARGAFLDRSHSTETKAKIGASNKGKKRPDLSERNRLTNSTRFKNLECPHCGKKGSGPTMHRYHFKNCKKVKHD